LRTHQITLGVGSDHKLKATTTAIKELSAKTSKAMPSHEMPAIPASGVATPDKGRATLNRRRKNGELLMPLGRRCLRPAGKFNPRSVSVADREIISMLSP
jgi:hypothetical protein